MSADNFWYICSHPGGGFTYVMAFASDNVMPLAPKEAPSFPTASAALFAATGTDVYVEYGYELSYEARQDLKEKE